MIKLDFTVPHDLNWTNWVAICHIATTALVQSHQNNTPIAITNLYRGELTRYHKHPFYGKCAYCESKVETTSPDYVEHFRPKGSVRDINNSKVQVTINGIPTHHPGYYWLAYKWENLLPTCWQCNTWQKNIGKGERFPVTGNYAVNPGDEINEIPDLINPMFEDPRPHLSIDSLGVLHAEPGFGKGAVCISFFGLNTRESLVNERKKEYTSVLNKMRLLYTISDTAQLKKELEEIKDIASGKDQYTIAARKAIFDVTSKADYIQNELQ